MRRKELIALMVIVPCMCGTIILGATSVIRTYKAALALNEITLMSYVVELEEEEKAEVVKIQLPQEKAPIEEPQESTPPYTGNNPP